MFNWSFISECSGALGHHPYTQLMKNFAMKFISLQKVIYCDYMYNGLQLYAMLQFINLIHTTQPVYFTALQHFSISRLISNFPMDFFCPSSRIALVLSECCGERQQGKSWCLV